MKKCFYIKGSSEPRPDAKKVIFCDGALDGTFREGVDLELSHWIPNQTPQAFKADSSTEISMKFVADGGGHEAFDLVVNNHVDVDGVLAVFVLLTGERAIQHRRMIVQAAEMGDFWGWGEAPARELFQALALLMEQLDCSGVDPQEIYARCFDRAQAVLSGERFPETDVGLQALEDSVALVEDGQIARTMISSRFVHYAIPRALADPDLDGALHVPSFNSPLSRKSLLLPHARARLDRERIQLVSIEVEAGWYHDLWYPGYTWADTPYLWRPPGVKSSGSSNVQYLDYSPLDGAVADLSRRERARGHWTLTRELSPFSTLAGRNFSVVLSFLAEDHPVRSSLPPATVVKCLASAFQSD